MKIVHLLRGTVVAALATSALATAEAGTLRIVGLPPGGPADQIKAALAVEALALPPGDTMMVYDARVRTLLGTISIPNDPTVSRPERKVEYILPAMAAVKKHFANALASPADGGFIDASSFLDEIGPVLADHGSEPARVALIGDPWFTAPGALEGKTYAGMFPSDGLILGDRSHSPFGTKGRRDLEGVTVDYCFTAGTTFLTSEHRERVERAWSLVVAQRGGQLTTFTSDLKTCMDRFGEAKAPDAKAFPIDPTDAQMLFMYRPKDAAPKISDAPPVKTGEVVPPLQNARQAEAARFDRPGRSTPPSTRSGIAWLGIQWREPVDLDLYVRCSPTAPFLFYANQLSPEGRHNFDYRMGTGSAFETVDLTRPCPDISKAQAFVNIYAGRARAPIKGVFAIQFDGGLYKSDFEMPALTGNGGAGLSMAGDMGAPHWVKIDLPTVLKLNPRNGGRSRIPVTQ